MNREHELSRRSLLGQAAGAAVLAQPSRRNRPTRTPRRESGRASTSAGVSSRATPPACNSRISRTRPGKAWTSLTIGASKVRSAKRARPGQLAGRHRLVSKRFPLPEAYRGRMVTIEFGGIYENSEVWINGQYLGKRPDGYIPFSYDLTPHLVFGRDNVIAVKVDNSLQTNCRWYSGSGTTGARGCWLPTRCTSHIGARS